MLLLFLLIIIIAISLPYYSLEIIYSRVFWKRISIISIVITNILFIESITLDFNYQFSLYNGLFNHTLQNSILIGLIFISSLILNIIGFNALSPNLRYLNIESNNASFPLINNLSISNNKKYLDINFSLPKLILERRDRERLIFVFSLIIGGIILIGSSDLLGVFLGLELQSYSAYILAASYKNYEPSESAGLKYFLLGALSSALIFMGISFLYVYSGNTLIDFSFLVLESINKSENNFTFDTIIPYLGVILILIGFLWKTAAGPLQAWSIDVYDAVPSKTTAILSTLPKIGIISFLIKIIFDLFSLSNFSLLSQSFFNLNYIHSFIYIVIVSSLLIGSIFGIFQSRVKRLLAYSSVLNVGFILIGILLINFGQFENFNPYFYLIQYIISTITIWLGLISIEKILGFEVCLNSQLQGIGNESLNKPKDNLFGKQNISSKIIKVKTIFIGISLTILILSTAGIPPMVGFFAKYEIILLSLKTDYFTLSILAILASLVSTYYYLNIIKNIWFKKSLNLKNSLSNTKTYIYNSENFINFNEFIGNSSFSVLLTLTITLFALQYSVIFIFLTLAF